VKKILTFYELELELEVVFDFSRHCYPFSYDYGSKLLNNEDFGREVAILDSLCP
jgi:hypothetical protein